MTDQEKHSINRFLKDWLIKQGVAISWNEYPDYFTWPGFGALWERAKKSKEWEKFWIEIIPKFFLESHWFPYIGNTLDLIDPQVFPKEWAEFLGFKEGE